MENLTGRALLCAALLAAGLGIAACGSSSGSSAPAATTPKITSSSSSTSIASPAKDPATIIIKNYAFGAPLTVEPGATVTVKNADGTTHSLAADDASFDSGNIFAGTTMTFVAPMAPGTYKFHCNFHNMHGALIVAG
jgi:plastocyanin